MDEIKTSGKHGVKLEEYKGEYQVVAYYDGFSQWAKFRVGKTIYTEKDRPVKIQLGNKETAIKVLQRLINEIDVPF